MRSVLVLYVKGVLIGLANIIPGVSGGTVALVLGIYDRLIKAIGRLGPATIGKLAGALRSGRLGPFATEHDLGFLLMLLVGALSAIIATSELMVYLLGEHHDPTYGFFFGLIAASIVVPWAMIGRRSWPEFASGLVAVFLVVGLGEATSPESRLEAARQKQAIRAQAEASGDAPATEADRSMSDLVVIGLSGATAISAMILPGVSGSFVMLLFGKYFEILAAISERDWVVLGVFALGCLIGLAVFSRLLAFLLDRYRSRTMAFLVGLMFGSLWSIWPFKAYEMVGEDRIDLANRWPAALGANEAITAAVALAGAAVVVAFLRWERSRK